MPYPSNTSPFSLSLSLSLSLLAFTILLHTRPGSTGGQRFSLHRTLPHRHPHQHPRPVDLHLDSPVEDLFDKCSRQHELKAMLAFLKGSNAAKTVFKFVHKAVTEDGPFANATPANAANDIASPYLAAAKHPAQPVAPYPFSAAPLAPTTTPLIARPLQCNISRIGSRLLIRGLK
eukprot:GFKZ01010115.1.p1 GENE.GFKZ01010115.1~~GFKZ01010115.1.p1  ORF type:complete len:175 (+),score=11.55 GFKZ01010115.1:432-956(+)